MQVHAVRTAFLSYLQHECGLARNSLQAYERDLDRFLEWVAAESGAKDWEDLTIARLGKYLAYLGTLGLAPPTIARHVASLKTFFKFLVLDERLAANAAAVLCRPGMWDRVPRLLSPAQVAALLASPNPRDRQFVRDKALLEIMAATGARASEAADLQVANVNLEQRFCKCRGKGNKERLVPFGDHARLALGAYLEAVRPAQLRGGPDPGTVFLGRRGRPLSRIDIWRIVAKHADRVGLAGKVSPHTLRHSFATFLLSRGADLRVIQELLGHASITTTQHYTRVDAARLKSVHNRFHPRG